MFETTNVSRGEGKHWQSRAHIMYGFPRVLLNKYFIGQDLMQVSKSNIHCSELLPGDS